MTKLILWLAILLAVAYSLLGQSSLGLLCAVSSTINFMWGCGRYAMRKGYAALTGVVLGIFNIVGLAVVAMLPDRGARRQSIWNAGLVTALVCGLVAIPLVTLLGISYVQTRRTAACAHNLSRIGAAMHNYRGEHGEFPPAFTTDAGQPMQSWRVLILPFLGTEEQELYRRFKLDKPWNAPENLRVAEEMPDVYRCPNGSLQRLQTSYVVVTGSGLLFDDQGSVPSELIQDLRSATIMVVEAPGAAVPWTQPADLNVSRLDGSDERGNPIRRVPGDFFFATMADGSVAKLPLALSAAALRELANPNDGKPARLEDQPHKGDAPTASVEARQDVAAPLDCNGSDCGVYA